jgi:magnesium chelatase subunit D
LHPGLRSILAFDLPSIGLELIANRLTVMVKTATGQAEVPRVTLGATQSEDELWGMHTLNAVPKGLEVSWQPGMLCPDPDATRFKLVLIPDLTRLSLAVARACVTQVGNNDLQLERHGRHTSQATRFLWLAACPRERVGEVSPHLLDRFALRLDGRRLVMPDRLQALMLKFGQPPAETEVQESKLDPRLGEALRSPRWPEIGAEVVPRMLAYQEQAATPSYPLHVGNRRAISFSRLAVAIAHLNGASWVTRTHVQQAESLLGLKVAGESDTPTPKPSQAAPKPAPSIPTLAPTPGETPAPTQELSPEVSEPVLDPGPATPFPVPALQLEPVTLYPEDQAPIQREAASLRLAPRRHRSDSSPRGTVIGVTRAHDLTDLAWVPSLLEAKKFEHARRKNNPKLDPNHLPLQGNDLRSYRRMPVPEQMLVLVIDYTSLG